MSDEIQEREVARRVFAAEFDDATLSYSESDEERAPNYVVTPTGARVNRLFAVGALTEVESVNDDVLRARIADPTGAFVTYAGQYQPDAAAFLERATPPCFVSLTGKGRTYQPEDSDRIFTSVRPESLNEVDADTRDRWVVAAAEATLDRLATTALALDLDARGDDLRTKLEARGVDASLASGVALAVDHYRPTEHYLEAVRRLTVQALELVAGDRDTVETLDVDPGESGPDELGPLPDVTASETATTSGSDVEPTTDAAAESTAGDSTTLEATADADAPVDATSDVPTGPDDAASDALDDSDAGPTAAPDASAEPDAAEQMAPTDASVETDTAARTASTDADAEADEVDGSAVAAESVGADPADATVDDDLGDFDAGGETTDDPGMYELDDEERAEIESEFDTEFSTGNEVDDPGEADIDVPDVDDLEAAAEATAAADSGPAADDGTAEPDAATQPTADVDGDATADSEPADSGGDADGTTSDETPDVDLETAAVEVMATLDDGDGADREAVVSAVVDEHGVEPDAVEDAIQEALMGGKCYEPAEGRLKSI